jgi:hypothetical protein
MVPAWKDVAFLPFKQLKCMQPQKGERLSRSPPLSFLCWRRKSLFSLRSPWPSRSIPNLTDSNNVRLTQLYKSIAADNASYHRLTTKRFSRIFKPVSISEACIKFHTASGNLLYFSSSSHLTLGSLPKRMLLIK